MRSQVGFKRKPLVTWPKKHVNGRRLLAIVALLYGYLLLRIVNLGEWLPFFIDEVHHMDRARHVLTFENLQTSTTPGKLLLYYYLTLFDLPDYYPGWLARTAVALFTMLGAAGTYALARSLFSHRAGMLALVLLAVFPFMTFHDRMVLSDPLASSFVVLVAWWSVQVVRRPTLPRATVLAVLINLMLLAKIVAAPLVILPFAAVVLLSQQPLALSNPLLAQVKTWWQALHPIIMRVALGMAMVWVPMMGIYVVRAIFLPDDTNAIVTDMIYAGISPEYDTSTNDVIGDNIAHVGQMLGDFFGLWFLLATVVTAGYLALKYPRRLFYLGSSIIIYWLMLMVVNARPNSRYFTLVGQLWVVLVAGGAITMLNDGLRQKSSVRYAGFVPLGLLVLWVGLYALPYSVNMINHVEDVPLPDSEIAGYFRNFSGYGFREALDAAEDLPPISENAAGKPVVYLAVRLCEYIPYHMQADAQLELICTPNLDTFEDDLNANLELYGAFYIVREDFQRFELDRSLLNSQLVKIDDFQRPYDGSTVELYQFGTLEQ